MRFLCDHARHVVCYPYSMTNLHRMAATLGLKRCWFHSTHYDMPLTRIAEITSQCELVSSKDIVRIIRGENP